MGSASSVSTTSILPEDESWRLLATQAVGRLGVIVAGRPLIFPVNFILDGHHIVIRTGLGTKFTHASLDRVCFEVDAISWAEQGGWSVLVQGVGVVITDAIDPDSVREQGLGNPSWDSSPKDQLIRIIQPKISGRRLAGD